MSAHSLRLGSRLDALIRNRAAMRASGLDPIAQVMPRAEAVQAARSSDPGLTVKLPVTPPIARAPMERPPSGRA